MKRNAIVYGVAVVLALTAYITLVVALALYLSTRMPPHLAVATVAGIAIGLILVLVVVAMVLNARDKRLREIQRRRAMARTNLIAATTLALARKKPVLAAGAAIALTAVFAMMRSGDDDNDA
ncbi:hypothetical protein [Rhizobium sp. SG2393]|uniref:hypothetical protein n=1 Tax=Rhizobium sp. SG2393 TaxID=3276279 RepID=UPI003671A6BF